MTGRHDPDAAGLRRRRFLGTAGVVAGTAWAAPAIISATPAAAGGPSPQPCAFSITLNSYSCATGGSFRIELPSGCDPVPLLIEQSTDGGPFSLLVCAAASRVFTGNVPGNFVQTIVFRCSVVTDCVTRTVIQTFTSIQMGGCPPPPGAPPDAGATAPRITTTRDGDQVTIDVGGS